MVFCFIQKILPGQHESYNIYFFCRTKRNFFSPKFNIRLYDKNSERNFVFPPPKSDFFFSNIGNQNICLEKNHNPPWKLNGPSLISCWKDKQSHLLQIHVTISISNLIILPVNIIWKKCTYLFEGSNLPIPHLGTLHGPGWTFVQLDFDINVYKCKCCKLRTSIKKRARGQIIANHIKDGKNKL